MRQNVDMAGGVEKKMKLIGFITNNRSAAETLFQQLLSIFKQKGIKAAVLREIISQSENDPFLSAEVFPDRLDISLPGNNSISSAIAYLSADIVLVDGFNNENTFPKILLDTCPGLEENYDRGLVTATFGTVSLPGLPQASTAEELSDIILERAFNLPDLDCAHCGCATCYEFAKEVVKGNRKPDDCVSLKPMVRILFGNFEMPMNPFISGIVEKTVHGMLSTLKGYRNGPVRIDIP